MKAVASPWGPLTLAADPAGALVFLGFGDPARHAPYLQRLARDGALGADPDLLRPAEAALAAYAAGEPEAFDLPVAPRGTPFQQRVWAELRRIPYGRTISYGELARRLGDARLTRAVGAANGANPVGIVIPCHRVIGADGGLVGYGGGLPMKEALLAWEAAHAPVFEGWRSW